ncbi:SlyX family protein [Rhodovulum euryhalinum]|uniref:SlyX protein n=1 Tax=Rhodovulum euryhalinum TaxID=35805 RepID=A0A4R2KIY6_9RHOB|nr:SlyX family protein [Rhodovulum euryhalinum]TCO73851.1 SlyX protein [Rhodovulum euryhalinum]
MTMDTELTALEERIARLIAEAEDLSDEVARQGREIAVLRRQVDMLLGREAQREYEDGGSVPLADQKPPHW